MKPGVPSDQALHSCHQDVEPLEEKRMCNLKSRMFFSLTSSNFLAANVILPVKQKIWRIFLCNQSEVNLTKNDGADVVAEQEW